jgi:hypothetical protein
MTSLHCRQIEELRRAMAFPPRTRYLVSRSPIKFRSLSNDRVSGNYFLLSAGFGLSSLAGPGRFSAVSDVGLGCSVAFDSELHSQIFDF